MNPTKFYICNEVSTVYWLEGEALAFAPIDNKHRFNIEDSGIVEEDMFQDELVSYDSTRTLGDIFNEARKALS